MSFWDILWFIVLSYLLIAYLMVLFTVLTDLFRDRDTGGFAKAMWILLLLVLPFLGLVAYLIARGQGMADRSIAATERARSEQEAYVRQVAGGTSASEQVTQAKALLDEGAISAQEFDRLKQRALAG